MFADSCRAPIATLDAMEEDPNNQPTAAAGSSSSGLLTTVDATSGLGDGGAAALGLSMAAETANANTLTPAVLASVRSSTSLSRQSSSVTPGLKFKNLGKSGLKVSNVGLGEPPGH